MNADVVHQCIIVLYKYEVPLDSLFINYTAANVCNINLEVDQ